MRQSARIHRGRGRKLGGWSLLLTSSLLASPALAQDDATRAAARALGTEGVEAYQSRDYAKAVEKLKQAYSVLHVPSLALWQARALTQTGRWVQATELYLEATRLEVSGSQASVQRQAQSDAQSELDALLPRVPSIVIQVIGAESAQLQIDLDGTSVPSGLVGAKRPTDPGVHVITVRHGEPTEQQRINLVERNSQVFDFSADAAASASRR